MIFPVLVHTAKRNSSISLIKLDFFKGEDLRLDLEMHVFYFHYLSCKVVTEGIFLFIVKLGTKNAEK
jgi:hypothetical protein